MKYFLTQEYEHGWLMNFMFLDKKHILGDAIISGITSNSRRFTRTRNMVEYFLVNYKMLRLSSYLRYSSNGHENGH